MAWLAVTIFSYFLNAVALTIDKFLLSKKIPNPAVYTFFISALSLVALILVPFGFQLYAWDQILTALVAGLFFTGALFFMFKAVSRHEASRVTPFMGGLQPIFIFILAFLFLGERLDVQSLVAFIIMISGTVVISWQRGGGHKSSYIMAIISTALFAISYTLNKYVYLEQDFISGFVWTRVGAFIGALYFLFFKSNRRDIFKEVKSPSKGSSSLFVGGQIAGALSFILVNYAISISDSVALVNALRGSEYVFLFFIILAISRKHPKLLKEQMAGTSLWQKIAATVLIMSGLFILFI